MVKLTKEELVEMVKRIRNSEGSDDEFDSWLKEIKESVSHPEVFNVIIRNTEGLNVEQIVDELIHYKAGKFILE